MIAICASPCSRQHGRHAAPIPEELAELAVEAAVESAKEMHPDTAFCLIVCDAWDLPISDRSNSK